MRRYREPDPLRVGALIRACCFSPPLFSYSTTTKLPGTVKRETWRYQKNSAPRDDYLVTGHLGGSHPSPFTQRLSKDGAQTKQSNDKETQSTAKQRQATQSKVMQSNAKQCNAKSTLSDAVTMMGPRHPQPGSHPKTVRTGTGSERADRSTRSDPLAKITKYVFEQKSKQLPHLLHCTHVLRFKAMASLTSRTATDANNHHKNSKMAPATNNKNTFQVIYHYLYKQHRRNLWIAHRNTWEEGGCKIKMSKENERKRAK